MLAGYELLKAFPGLDTHEAEVMVPVVENDQDIARMQRGLDAVWSGNAAIPPGYLIRGHGSYVWARDMPGALARPEALESIRHPEAHDFPAVSRLFGLPAPPG